jgi:hypothetical protein
MSLYGRTDSNANKSKVEKTISASSQAKTIVFVDETEAALNENRTRGIDGPGWWSYFTYTDAAGNTRHKAEKLVALSNPDTNANETQSDDTIAADAASAVTISVQPANASFYTDGAILTVTSAGTAATGTASYTAVTGTASGSGTGAQFTVARAGGSYTVTVTNKGSGYAANETITVLGSALGGVDTTNDLTITVATVGTNDATFTVSTTTTGTPGTLAYRWQRQSATGTTWTNITNGGVYSGATSATLTLTNATSTLSGTKFRVKITSAGGTEEVTSNSATLTFVASV